MPKIQWYPGHISKAERQLKEQLNKVDVILEVLDARIPLASHHPQVPQWIGEKPRILVLNRVDMIPEFVRQQWTTWFDNQGETPYFTDAKQGKGVKVLHKATRTAGVSINRRRRSRGMLPRPVRAVVIGLPNVGKSALINRLLGRKIVKSARRVGVTRQIRWVKISDTIELLDAPGIIPGNLENQKDAVKLAICEDIGEAAYDNQYVAGMLVDFLVELNFEEILRLRYSIDPLDITGEEYVRVLGYERYQGDVERASRQLLNDFRKGLMGSIPLELPLIN
ncbi:ribosome biogenesis GTPase YlqF [Cyanobacterium sp. uoEpiScrs1]|uniref:ribosome biogenesis GTPase YlqF n=1 Tax=Cyanobacterium sp. uoEpiScrs1 TaxID=2976343 RepID=UPI00226AAF6D|nr:ribosome biogenesis GTPase YlqF [Cyanobacterium sp. uoEpiScrs1]